MMNLHEQAVLDFECVEGLGVCVRVCFSDERGKVDVSGWQFKCGVSGPWVEKVAIRMVPVGGNVAELMWNGMSEGRYVYDVVGVNDAGDDVALLRGRVCVKDSTVAGGMSADKPVVDVVLPSVPSGVVEVTVRGQGDTKSDRSHVVL